MKDKNVAAVLALVFGIFGVHRFYLNQVPIGIVYCLFFWTGIPAVLGLIDCILFLVMDQREFDQKYNRQYVEVPRDDYRQSYGRPQGYQPPRVHRQPPPPPREEKKENPFKANGIKKYKDYDFQGAIEDFKKALSVDARDVAVHFNIACAYSITEQADKAFFHLSKAVELGFVDFDKLKTHDALAYIRIQPEWETFVANGYKLVAPAPEAPEAPKAIEAPDAAVTESADLLEQIKRLGELREKGFLTEEEFANQKKKLLG